MQDHQKTVPGIQQDGVTSLVALSEFDEFLLNTQIRTLSGTVLGTSQNTDVENRNQLEIVPRKIAILEWSSLAVSPSNSIDLDSAEVSHSPTVTVTQYSLFFF